MKTFAKFSKAGMAIVLTSLMACTSDTIDEPISSSDVVLTIYGGDEQAGEINTRLPLPLMVRATTPSGEPIGGLTIQWTVVVPEVGSGVSRFCFGQTILLAENGCAKTSNTDANGVARMESSLGGKAAISLITATYGGRRVQFRAIAQVQGASMMAPNPSDHGMGQTDTVLAVLKPFKVLVTDHLGKPAAGVVVRWHILSGYGGLLTNSETTSDTRGIAETTYTAGTSAGSVRVEASVIGLPGSPIRFDNNITPGNPVRFAAYEGLGQFGKVGTAVRPYRVAVQDRYGNNVSGVHVDWAIAAGGGLLSVMSNLTNTFGATVTHTLGPAEGMQAVIATATGLPASPEFAPVTFTTRAVQELVIVATAVDDYYGYYETYAFVPQSVKVAVGTSVTWFWDCPSCRPDPPTVHNITFEDASVVGSPSKSTGSHTVTFQKAGTYRYRCTIHSTSFTEGVMRGEIIVQ